MRQISFIFLVAGIFSCKGSSSSISMDNEKDVRKALVGKWESTYMETSGGRLQVPDERKIVVTFEESGVYDARFKGGVIANSGNWSYNPRSQQLNKTSRGVTYGQRILSLTDKDLLLNDYTFLNDKVVDSAVETYKKL
jgi:hypothetical protein